MNFFLVGINIFELFNIFISHEKPDFFSIVALLDKRDVTSGSLNFYSGGKMYFNDLGACIWISMQKKPLNIPYWVSKTSPSFEN